MDLDLRVVRYFVAVGEELHFGRAAKRLFISQPALSKQIQRLEEQVGARLLIRNSRQVALTARGEAFLDDARELLRLADRMQTPGDDNQVRIAHVFELSTSRDVADAFARARPEARLVQHAMHSNAQLQALVEHRLDVAILRITPTMLTEHPNGWSHTLLRLEPMQLVGQPGDPECPTVSLHERPVHVFGDTEATGLYNAHGNFLSAMERHAGLRMRWHGTPGAFSLCHATWQRILEPAHLFEFDSYAEQYRSAGLPVHRPQEIQPHYPWSIAWRNGPVPSAVADFLEIAHDTATERNWRAFDDGSAVPWLPADDPVALELGVASPAELPGQRPAGTATAARQKRQTCDISIRVPTS